VESELIPPEHLEPEVFHNCKLENQWDAKAVTTQFYNEVLAEDIKHSQSGNMDPQAEKVVYILKNKKLII
jgi:hypothetical protein